MIEPTNNDNNLWHEVVNNALLGTNRRPPTLPPGDTPLGSTLSRLNGSDLERVLLGSAATISLYRQAGYMPAVDNVPLPEPCPPEDLPLCSLHSAGHLAAILVSYDDALPEWLHAAVAAGQVARPESLPALLDKGRNHSDLIDALLAVIGKRGRWMAAQNPDWGYVTGAGNDKDVWETGDRDARILFLERLRAHDPARSRELVAATWGQEKADDRAAMLATLSVGLSMDDEPFLEERLDDRSKEVRQQAADLLSRLPESGYVHRMIQGVLPLLDFKKVEQRGLFGHKNKDASYIEVLLAQDYTATMKRDGIQRKSPDPRMGERAYWLSQMLACIPPRFWVETWGVDAANIVSASTATKDWHSVLIGAWVEATRRYKDVVWAEAFLVHDAADLVNSPARTLLGILPPDNREAFVLNILQHNPSALYTKAMPAYLLLQLQTPWSTELSRAVLNGVSHYIVPASDYSNWQVRQDLKGFYGRYMPSSIREEAASILLEGASSNPHFTDAVDDFLATLEFRQEMLKEFTQ